MQYPSAWERGLVVLNDCSVNIQTAHAGFLRGSRMEGQLVWIHHLNPAKELYNKTRAKKIIEEARKMENRTAASPYYISVVTAFAWAEPAAIVMNKLVVVRSVQGEEPYRTFEVLPAGFARTVFNTEKNWTGERYPIRRGTIISLKQRPTAFFHRFSARPTNPADDTLIKYYRLVQPLPLLISSGFAIAPVPRQLVEMYKTLVSGEGYTWDTMDIPALTAVIQLKATVNAYNDYKNIDGNKHFVVLYKSVVTPSLIVARFILPHQRQEGGWEPGALVSVDNGRANAMAKIEKSEATPEGTSTTLLMEKVEMSDEFVSEILGSAAFPATVQLHAPLVLRASRTSRLCRQDPWIHRPHARASQIVEQVYSCRLPEGWPSPVVPSSDLNEDVPEDVTIRRACGTVHGFTLEKEQRQAVRLLMSEEPVAFVDASAGAGKTLLAAVAINEFLGGDDQRMVVVNTATNTAANQALSSLCSLRICSDRIRPLRMISARSDKYTSSDCDVHTVIASLADKFPNQMDEDTKKEIRLFKRTKERFDSLHSKCKGQALKLEAEDLEDFVRVRRWLEEKVQLLLQVVMRVYRPNVIVATETVIIKTISRDGDLSDRIHGAERSGQLAVFNDEASQLATELPLLWALLLPQAVQRYYGDPAQLPPWSAASGVEK